MIRLLVRSRQIELADEPLGGGAVDDFEPACLTLVNVHVAFGDIEPPAAQVKRSVGDPLAHDRVRRQVFELDQYIELRELVAAIPARIERPFLVKAEHG